MNTNSPAASAVPVFVGACYLYDWGWLRVLTTITLVQISSILGISMVRTGAEVVTVGGVSAQFIVACTMIDAFFGAIPLLWRTNASLAQNFMRMTAVLAGVFVLNIVRLELGFIAMTRGVPWWLAHEVVAGVAYFCLYDSSCTNVRGTRREIVLRVWQPTSWRHPASKTVHDLFFSSSRPVMHPGELRAGLFARYEFIA